MGILSGAGNVVFIAVVNNALHPRSGAAVTRPAFLIGLCGIVVLSRFMSDVILIRLSERVVFELRVRLSQAILQVPLRRIEIWKPLFVCHANRKMLGAWPNWL